VTKFDYRRDKMKKGRFSNTLFWDLGLLLVTIVWGGGFVVTKNVLDVMKPITFIAIRFSVASIPMIFLFYKKLRKASKEDVKNGCILGVLLFLGFLAQTVGAAYTTPAKTSFITGLNVVLVPFAAIILTKKFPQFKAVVTAFIALGGIALLSLNETLTISYGDFLTVLCAIAYALHIVAISYYARKTDPLVLASIQIFFTAIASIVFALIFEPMPSTLSMGSWIGIFYTAILGTVGAFIIQNMAQKHTPPTHTAVILSMEAVFGALASAIFWHEALTLRAIIGCVLIFAAIIANEVDFKQAFSKK